MSSEKRGCPRSGAFAILAGMLVCGCAFVVFAALGWLGLRNTPLQPAMPLETAPLRGAPAAPALTIQPTAAVQTALPDAPRSGGNPERPTEIVPAGPAGDRATGDRASQSLLLAQLSDKFEQNYVDPAFNGVNWSAQRQHVQARIDAGVSDEQLYEALRAMVDTLGDAHSRFVASNEKDSPASALGLDCDVATDKQSAVVLTVMRDSPAGRAGIRAHDRILAVDGETPLRTNGHVKRVLRFAAMPPAVTLRVASPGAAPRDITINNDGGSASAEIEARMLAAGSGYIAIPDFVDSATGANVRAAFKLLTEQNGTPLTGLIIDMRTNGGGGYSQLVDTLALFTDGIVGKQLGRDGQAIEMRVNAEPEGNSQTVPLVVLTSRYTNSFADVFSGILQFKDRAKLVGQPSAGNTETVFSYPLDDGSTAVIAEQRFQLPDGRSWEAIGLRPDLAVAAEWETYTAADDAVLAAAQTLLAPR